MPAHAAHVPSLHAAVHASLAAGHHAVAHLREMHIQLSTKVMYPVISFKHHVVPSGKPSFNSAWCCCRCSKAFRHAMRHPTSDDTQRHADASVMRKQANVYLHAALSCKVALLPAPGQVAQRHHACTDVTPGSACTADISDSNRTCALWRGCKPPRSTVQIRVEPDRRK